MSAADDVKKAWTDAGRVPRYHFEQQRILHRNWPVLAEAIEKLVRETPSRVAITDEPTTKHEIADLLLEHRRNSIGPCACGWFKPGYSHAEHVAEEIMKVVAS